jgi:hypothetical protein
MNELRLGGISTSGAATYYNTQPVVVRNKEVAFAGYDHDAADIINVHGSGASIIGNYFHDPILLSNYSSQPFNGKGIELWYGAANNLIENNTITGAITAGIGLSRDSVFNSIRRNVITGTTGDGSTLYSGAGILVTGYSDTTGTLRNTFSENSIFGNAGLGIDIDSSGSANSAGDGVTANDGLLSAGEPNELVDHPVITLSNLIDNQLVLSGYVGSAPNQSIFAGLE